jgi:hypothetical protein
MRLATMSLIAGTETSGWLDVGTADEAQRDAQADATGSAGFGAGFIHG